MTVRFFDPDYKYGGPPLISDFYHECGIAALYHLGSPDVSNLVSHGDPGKSSWLMSLLLLGIQNRGQLSVGITTCDPHRSQPIDTYKGIGSVIDVFHLNHAEQFRKLMDEYEGTAVIGHVRYTNSGNNILNDAELFERHHIEKPKWFSFGFDGLLANSPELREEILQQPNIHLARETDTEILMHLISQELSNSRDYDLLEILQKLSRRIDGAYNIVYLNALGEMFVARDPQGTRPLYYAVDGPLFAAASGSVTLSEIGLPAGSICNLEPGHAIIISEGKLKIEQFTA